MASTSPITTNRRTATLLALLWGGVLAALAARPFAAEILASEGWPPSPPSTEPAAIEQRAERFEHALTVSPSAPLAEKAALARLRLAESYGRQSDWGRRQAERAEQLAQTSLSAAPGNPFLWLWLSQLDAQRDGISPASARAWLASVRSGPFDPDLAEDRLWLGLMQEPAFDEAEREALTEQIHEVAAWQMWTLVSSALRADSTAIVRRTLAGEPALLADFNARVARYPR